MYITVKTSIRKVKNHGSWPGGDEFIPANTAYLHLNNGTIGQGARGRNIPKKDAIKLLKALIEDLEKSPSTDIISYNEANFPSDDIPF